MNSLDPWRIIAVNSYGEVVLPRPRYEHPFHREVPSWIHYGGGGGTKRYLFEGAFIGADPAGANMSNIDQRSSGITFKKELDDRQVLHVEICVDGKCYRTSMDLAPAIAMVMTKIAQSHADLHKMMGPTLSGEVVATAIDRGVSVAGDALIGMLAHQHTHGSAVDHAVAVEGFFGDIGHALSGAANAVGGVLKELKGPASLAAGAAATYFGGPAAGPMAAQLTGALIDAAPGGGHPAKQAAAQQTVAAANQVAKTDPTVQAALDAAHHATSQTTMAALGHVPAVPATPNTLAAAVQKFLPLAMQAATGSGSGGGGGTTLPADLQSALSMFGNMLGGGGSGGGGDGASVSGYPYAVVGSFWDDVKGAVLTVTGTKATNQFIKDNHLEPYVKFAAQAVATYYGGPAAGAAAGAISPMVMNLGVDDKQKAQAAHADLQGVKAMARQAGPHLGQAADLAHGAIQHTATAYQVAQIVRDAKAGNPQAQQVLVKLRTAAASGDRKAKRALHAARMINRAQQSAPVAAPGPGAPSGAGPGPAPGAPPEAPPGSPPGSPPSSPPDSPPGSDAGPGGSAPVGAWHQIADLVVGCEACEPASAAASGWYDIVGAAIDDVRSHAQGIAGTNNASVVGVIRTARGVWQVRGFRDADAADDWLGGITRDPSSYTYAAIYDKTDVMWPHPLNEKVGTSHAPMAPEAPIPREFATASGTW